MDLPLFIRMGVVSIFLGIGLAGLCFAKDAPISPSKDIWEDQLIHPFDAINLTEQQIDRFLNRLAQSNAERAAELQKLRINQPQRFRWEIREEMANRFFQKIIPPSDGTAATPVSPSEPVPTEPSEAARKRYEELLVWLEKAFPQQAKVLKTNPSPSAEHLEDLFNRYEPVMRAERYNPPLAEAMKEDIRTQMRCDEILIGLPHVQGQEREKVIQQLTDLTTKRFDLIVLKHQLQQQHLRNRLERLNQELDKQKQELEVLKGSKDQAVHERVKELVERTDKTKWD